MSRTISIFIVALAVAFGAAALGQNEPIVCNGPNVSFESGGMPADWSFTTNALPGGEFVISADNSSGFWDPGPATDGVFYASANDDLPGSGSDGSADYLFSNVFDLTNMTNATLTFDYHFNAAFGHIAGGVEVSGDGGGTWDGEIIVPAGDTWQNYVLDLSAYDGMAAVQVRFHSDDGGAWAAGYAVDNIGLTCDESVVGTLTCNGAAVSFEDGLMPGDWSITTLALPGGEFVVSQDNSSGFWDPGPPLDGTWYASANDDLPGSGSDGSADYLYSNVFDLTGMAVASLTFDYHFNAAFGHIAGGVEISPDGGATWDAEIIVPAGDTWQTYVLDLAAYGTLPAVQVRFHSDDGGSWAAGYAVDNVVLNCDIPVTLQSFSIE